MSIFKNLKVVELASVLAGPSVGQFFAELGATVLKVENPSTKGDVTRTWKLASEKGDSSLSAYFYSANWGKKSVVLNLKEDHDRAQLYQLTSDADIVICSYKQGDAEKLKVDYTTLAKDNPKLIYANITGYTHSSKPGYDAVIQAESGFMHMNGTPDGPPVKMPVALMDVLTAHHLKEGILTALLERTATGKGALVEVSLFDAAISSLANQATNYLVAGHDPGRIGSEHPNIVPYGTVFNTADNKHILLAVGTDRQFQSLLRIVKLPALLDDQRFKHNAQRVQHREALIPLLREAISTFDAAALLSELEKANIPAGAVNRVSDSLNSSEAQDVIIEGKGVRNVVFRVNGKPVRNNLGLPPEYQP